MTSAIFNRNTGLDRSVDKRFSRFFSRTFSGHDICADQKRPVERRPFFKRPIFDQRPCRRLCGVNGHPLIWPLKGEDDRLTPIYLHDVKLPTNSGGLPVMSVFIGRFRAPGEVAA